MCVDFHSHLQPDLLTKSDSQQSPTSLSSSPSSSPPPPPRCTKFKLTKDTSIINYWDSSASVGACVHHFNLYDLEARGFVRPFCLAYVSYDPSKPVTYFEQLRTKFTEITDLLKKSNYNQFKSDLEQRCADLKFTKEVFKKWSDFSTSDEKLKETRLKLVKEFKLDAKSCARLTASSFNEQTKMAQINAIDSMIGELESVLNVVLTELKIKNWILNNKPLDETLTLYQRPNSANYGRLNQLNDSRTRSFTYPLNTSNNSDNINNSRYLTIFIRL